MYITEIASIYLHIYKSSQYHILVVFYTCRHFIIYIQIHIHIKYILNIYLDMYFICLYKDITIFHCIV